MGMFYGLSLSAYMRCTTDGVLRAATEWRRWPGLLPLQKYSCTFKTMYVIQLYNNEVVHTWAGA